MGFSQKLIKEGRVSVRVVCLVSNLVLPMNPQTKPKYLLSCNTLGHSFYSSSASRNVGVIQFHATYQLHHRSRAKTNLPLLVCLSHSSNRSLSQSLHFFEIVEQSKNNFAKSCHASRGPFLTA